MCVRLCALRFVTFLSSVAFAWPLICAVVNGGIRRNPRKPPPTKTKLHPSHPLACTGKRSLLLFLLPWHIMVRARPRPLMPSGLCVSWLVLSFSVYSMSNQSMCAFQPPPGSSLPPFRPACLPSLLHCSPDHRFVAEEARPSHALTAITSRLSLSFSTKASSTFAPVCSASRRYVND